MENLVAYRIRNARRLKGLSLQDVANELNVSKQMVNKYEKGLSMPNSSNLILMSRLFGLKIDYFFNSFKIELGEVNFRKKSSFPAKAQDALKEQIKIKLENYLYIEDALSIDFNFVNPIADVEIHTDEDIERAVARLRHQWDIGIDPVHNIIQLLEDKRIKIIEIDDSANKFDGLATIVDDKYPVIVINSRFPVERKRFSLVHELGHLLLNLSSQAQAKEEAFCNKFASEFLLPRTSLLDEFGQRRKHISLSELIAIQEKYGVSIKAIYYKLKEIGILSESQHADFYKRIHANRSLERDVDKSRFSTPENSNRFERLVYRALSQEVISISKASSLLNKNVDVIKETNELF